MPPVDSMVSFARILAIIGGLEPIMPKGNNPLSFVLAELYIVYSPRNRLNLFHFQSDIRNTHLYRMCAAPWQCFNCATSLQQLRSKVAATLLNIHSNFAQRSQQLRLKFAKYKLCMLTYFLCLPYVHASVYALRCFLIHSHICHTNV